jgi:hypothetical protein
VTSPYPTTREIKRLAKAAKAEGVVIADIIFHADGRLDIIGERRKTSAGEADEALEKWEPGIAGRS